MTVGSIETALTKKRGNQPSWYAYWKAWIAWNGSAKSMKVSACEARRCEICDWTLESVTSYDCVATIRFACLPSPRLSPRSRSFP